MDPFNEYGNRIPFEGMRIAPEVSPRFYQLNQPDLDQDRIYRRFQQYLSETPLPVSLAAYRDTCARILSALEGNSAFANLTRAVHVPFLCPPATPRIGRGTEIRQHLARLGKSFEPLAPDTEFKNTCEAQGLPGDDVLIASESRYEQFEQARNGRWVGGWYFPNCIPRFDLTSQRKQMRTLPEIARGEDGFEAQVVLSGALEAAVACIGCPFLLRNKERYAHVLCLSALQADSNDVFFYSFEGYDYERGYALIFGRRTNRLRMGPPPVTQVSEAFAGGLTVFAPIG